MYDLGNTDHFKGFDNAGGLITNEVAYEVTGYMAFQALIDAFPPETELRIGDVGCFLGNGTARWATHAQRMMNGRGYQILGMDIFAENVARATHTYGENPRLKFALYEKTQLLPLIDNQPYHLIFAIFALDTIADFDEVKRLCSAMYSALGRGGEIYLLRLHPQSLCYAGRFQEYLMNTKAEWSHGDSLLVELSRRDGTKIELQDTYWEPKQIGDLFLAEGCQVDYLQLTLNSQASEWLKYVMAHLNVNPDLPEWYVPLYQLIRIKRS